VKEILLRKSESTTQPQSVVPIVSTIVPSTLASALAPNIPLETTSSIEVTGT